ncbi:hypothetical protein MNV49_004181 [Pseudohyphozyma bogoriensis]|nr:hypothetical protein MNV49_004181 [Pseudohyphozyma bogoriensis]
MSPPPDSLHPLLNALVNAVSNTTELRDASTAQLTAWATTPGYYASLAEVIANRDLELGPASDNIRLQAVIQLRSGVDKYWRKSAANAIALPEKQAIRPRLLALVDEPNRKLARNVADCIAKIARLDYGIDWDELPTSLLASLQAGLSHTTPTSARLVLHRTLLFIHRTIKSLSSNRLLKGRVLMSQISAILFPTLKDLQERMLQLAIEKLRGTGLEGVEEESELELSLLAFKCLSKLMVYGFKDPSLDPSAQNFFTMTLTTFDILLTLRTSLLQVAPQTSPNNPNLIALTKHVTAFGKLYSALFNHDAAAFVRLGGTQKIIEMYWNVLQGAAVNVGLLISDEVNSVYPEKFVVKSLLLLSATMGDWASKSPIDIPETFVAQFVELIVTKLLPLRPVDLEKWTEEPEEWMNEEEMERWEFELRPCAEHVLKNLLSQYSEEIGPLMADMLRRTREPQDTAGLLLKEGVYCAFGRSASQLGGAIDFDKWLETDLVPEAAGTDSNYRIIRRRVAWLVGNWVGEDISPETRLKIYQLLVHLLGRNPSTDTAIRLTAASSLAKCDTWDFDKDSFLPFLQSAVEETVQLLGEVELPDSQMRLNGTLGVIIDRVGENILPYAGPLAVVLAGMWEAATESHQFQATVLVTLTKLCQALSEHSQGLHAQACPVIQISADPSLPSHVYLEEDGLELWQILMRRSSVITPEMYSLLPLLVSLLSRGTDTLPRVLKILESYLLLDGPRVLQLCATELFIGIEGLLGELKLEAVKYILHAVDTVLQAAPIATWAAALEGSGTMVKLVNPLNPAENALIVSRYLCTLSRIVIAGPETFHQLVEATAARMQVTSDDVLDIILYQYLDKIDNMSQAAHRKLTALALAYLLPTTRPLILTRLGELLSIWSSVMSETQENETGDAELYEDEYQETDYDFAETLETTRRQGLSALDPVHSQKMSTVLRQKLAEAEALNGGPAEFSAKWLSRVDPEVVAELLKRLDGSLVG